MGLCKKHLNWTLVLGHIVAGGAYFIFAVMFAIMGIFDNVAILLYIVLVFAVLWLQGWYLHRKNRSLLFILFSPIILLLLANKRTTGFGMVKVWGMGDNSKFVSTNDNPKDIREVLSCPTCEFFRKQAGEENQVWCNAHDAPNIIKNYCETFKVLGGKV